MLNNRRASLCALVALMVGTATVVSASTGSVARDAWLALPPPEAKERYCDGPYSVLFGGGVISEPLAAPGQAW